MSYCPLSNLPCLPGCAWCRKTTNADGTVTFRCAVLGGANDLHRIAAVICKPKTETQRSCHNCRHERNSFHGHPPCTYCSQHSNWQPTVAKTAEPQPKPVGTIEEIARE